MLSYYTRRSSGEGFQETTERHEYTSWVHGSAVTQPELDELVAAYDLSANIVRDVRDVNELPRVEYGAEKRYMYIFLRVPRISRRGEVVTSPLLVIAGDTMFFTLGHESSFRPSEVAEQATHQMAQTPIQLSLISVAGIISEYELLIRKTTRLIRDVGHRLRKHEVTNKDFVQFVTIEDDLNEYSTNLDGMQMLVRHLREDRRGIFSTGDMEMIDDLLLHIQQLSVAVASQLQSVQSIRDAYGTIANNSLNQRMKTLTVFTVLIALPNVFYGMYGMNVALPFANEPWAYAAIVVFTFLLIFAMYGLARRFKIF